MNNATFGKEEKFGVIKNCNTSFISNPSSKEQLNSNSGLLLGNDKSVILQGNDMGLYSNNKINIGNYIANKGISIDNNLTIKDNGKMCIEDICLDKSDLSNMLLIYNKDLFITKQIDTIKNSIQYNRE